MTNRIDEDHKDFHDVYSGRKHKQLKKFINNGKMFRRRPDGKGRIPMTVPRIDIPHVVFGNTGDGVGRGGVKPGDVIGKDDEGGKGPGAGQGEGEGVEIAVDLEEVLKFMQEELELPNLKPKPNQTYEEDKKRYNSISLTGPESLLHKPRTLKQAMKRQCADGSIWDLHKIPGFNKPIRLLCPTNNDKRYRQYRIIKKPTSNAVVFFARDGSASMDQFKCDIVSDMSWWIDQWIRKFYERVERCYIWHDTQAQEVDEARFYKYRYGGGTTCSSAFKLIEKQFENRFPPNKWNIYVVYFTDGDNWGDDNQVLCDFIKEKFPSSIVNFVGIAQIMSWHYQDSLKHWVDDNLGGIDNIRTTSIGNDETTSDNGGYTYGTQGLSDEERDSQVKKAIVELLGKQAIIGEGI